MLLPSIPIALVIRPPADDLDLRPKASLSAGTVAAYTGLFRMPDSLTLRDGTISFASVFGEPVRTTTRKKPLSTKAGNYSVLVGFLPFLEVGLSALEASPFNGQLDDRAIGVKVGLLTEPKFPISLSVGDTDVAGTHFRKSRYVVAGKQIGSLSLYAGYGSGLMKGAMGGGTLQVGPDAQLVVEKTGQEALAGLKFRIGDRVVMLAGAGKNRKSIFGVSYSAPLTTPDQERVGVAGSDPLPEMAAALSRLGGGAAGSTREEDRLVVAYEDVQARDPLATLRQALDIVTARPLPWAKDLSLTVTRFGIALITVEGPFVEVHQFIHGWSSVDRFLRDVRISDGGPVGAKPGAGLVTIQPLIDYRLGTRNELPNREWLRFKAVKNLTGNLLAAGSFDVKLHDSIDESPSLSNAQMSLAYSTTLPSGRISASLSRQSSEPWTADVEVLLSMRSFPLTFRGSVGAPLGSRGKLPFASEVGLDLAALDLSLWARYERFQRGDVGPSAGLSRRFGQTRVTLSGTRIEIGGEPFYRGGVMFEIPLPDISSSSGGFTFATSRNMDFSYRPREFALPALGRGVPRNPTFGLDDLTADGQLTADFIRTRVERLRLPD